MLVNRAALDTYRAVVNNLTAQKLDALNANSARHRKSLDPKLVMDVLRSAGVVAQSSAVPPSMANAIASACLVADDSASLTLPQAGEWHAWAQSSDAARGGDQAGAP